jgi:hypothetical protein
MECDAETVARQPILLGYHCAQAGLIEKATIYYRRAGDQSAARSAFAETKTLLDRGLTLAATLPDSPGRRLLETELWATLGRILHMEKGFGDGEALIALGRAIDLARTLHSTESLTGALRDRALNLLLRGDHKAGLRDAQELFSVAETTGDAKARIFAHGNRGNFQFARGCFREACADQEAARELHSREFNLDFDVTYTVNWVQGVRFFAAHCLACLGHVDKATTEIARLIEEVRQVPPFARAVALGHLCRFALITRDMAAFREYANSLASIGKEQGYSLYVLLSRYYKSYLEVHDGSIQSGIQEMQTVLTALGLMGYQFFGSYNRLLLAEALTCANLTNNALAALDDGLALSANTGETWSDAELHRRKGELLLGEAELNPIQGEQELRLAVDIARDQEAKLFELRAATSLAHLLSRQGRRADARELLEPVYTWFTDSTNMRELREARELLAQFDHISLT